jgi:hypothetical protein
MANIQNVVVILASFTLNKEQRSRVFENKMQKKINSSLPKREEISGIWRNPHVIFLSFSQASVRML